MILSGLGKTWLLDLDGTIVWHNGYLQDEGERFLPGAREWLLALPEEDTVLFLTARRREYQNSTEAFLKKHGIRYHAVIYGLPPGERILINDQKESGLQTAFAISTKRNCFGLPGIVCNEEL